MSPEAEGEQCAFVFDPEEWKRTHDEPCHIDSDADEEILIDQDGRQVWECPHPAVKEGKCVFHCPADPPADCDPSAEFLAIVNGDQSAGDETNVRPPQFIGGTFGDFEIDCEQLGGDSTIDLRYTSAETLSWAVDTVESPIDARGIHVTHLAVFQHVTFDGTAQFSGAQFNGEAWFADAQFKVKSIVVDAPFEFKYMGAQFEGVQFDGTARFDGVQFDGTAKFDGAQFDDEARFRNCIFSYVSFTKAVFNDTTSFRTDLTEKWFPISMFQGPADFSEVTAQETIDFRIVDENKVISNELVTFTSDADFSDVTFDSGAIFDGVSFRTTGEEPPPEVTFNGADLEGATFRDADFTGVSLAETDLTNTTLRNTTFTGATLEGAILSRANLYGAEFTNARLYGALFGDARISDGTRFIDSGSWWTWVPGITSGMQTLISDPRTDPVYTPLESGTETTSFSGDPIGNCTRAASVYAQLETLARENADPELASTCFRWRKDMQRLRYKRAEGEGNERQLGRYALSKVTNVVTRYGDSPWRVVGWSAFVILLSAVLFPFTEGIGTDGTIPTPDWLRPLYFSIVTFTTVGYGDYHPKGPLAQVLASSESLVGALLVALLVAVLARRVTR